MVYGESRRESFSRLGQHGGWTHDVSVRRPTRGPVYTSTEEILPKGGGRGNVLMTTAWLNYYQEDLMGGFN